MLLKKSGICGFIRQLRCQDFQNTVLSPRLFIFIRPDKGTQTAASACVPCNNQRTYKLIGGEEN